MLEKYAESLIAELTPFLPEKWERVVLHGSIEESSSDFIYYTRIHNDYKSSLDYIREKKITMRQLSDVFERLWKICRLAQNSAEGTVWRNFTFVVDNTGHFSIDYGYEEAGVTSDWKEKYLV